MIQTFAENKVCEVRNLNLVHKSKNKINNIHSNIFFNPYTTNGGNCHS